MYISKVRFLAKQVRSSRHPLPLAKLNERMGVSPGTLESRITTWLVWKQSYIETTKWSSRPPSQPFRCTKNWAYGRDSDMLVEVGLNEPSQRRGFIQEGVEVSLRRWRSPPSLHLCTRQPATKTEEKAKLPPAATSVMRGFALTKCKVGDCTRTLDPAKDPQHLADHHEALRVGVLEFYPALSAALAGATASTRSSRPCVGIAHVSLVSRFFVEDEVTKEEAKKKEAKAKPLNQKRLKLAWTSDVLPSWIALYLYLC
ncbi:uncharacterized protein BXZ73DRAFT_82885 [Epithele typhae]|uniref:uncharacterized protein n=1 Tax=Epithele typhae TaxID=378194 RepID=UPI0020074BB0|nr:uncharacterized protein BXZ73DRAFT_82885 [Epithele typhae]KAH9911307.1 hypothetical protein BXZ73DRAFT_82885 [Epithele typhae]